MPDLAATSVSIVCGVVLAVSLLVIALAGKP